MTGIEGTRGLVGLSLSTPKKVGTPGRALSNQTPGNSNVTPNKGRIMSFLSPMKSSKNSVKKPSNNEKRDAESAEDDKDEKEEKEERRRQEENVLARQSRRRRYLHIYSFYLLNFTSLEAVSLIQCVLHIRPRYLFIASPISNNNILISNLLFYNVQLGCCCI